MLCNDFKLSQEQLKKWAIFSNKAREKFRRLAMEAGLVGKDKEAQEEFKVSQLAKGIEKHQHSHRSRLDRALNKTQRTETPVGLRRKGKHRAKLSTDEQLEIASRAIHDCEPIKDLAKEYRVSQSRIS